MQRQIDILNEQRDVKVFDRCGERYIKVDDCVPQLAALKSNGDDTHVIQLGDHHTRIQMAVKGETAYIRAFGRTFTLHIVDQVEQAAQKAGGGGNSARAPMPGVVVEVKVVEGDRVKKGQPVMTIESMKILTVIKAPRDGEVSRVNYEDGQTFDKNAVLVSLREKEKN